MSGAGGKCQHRVGCFFHLDMETWSDALLALSVMQAAANDVFQRWKCMPLRQRIAADATLAGLPTLREASAPESNSALDESEAEHDDRHAILDSDTAALKTAGVAKATPLYPPPIVIYQEGTTPPDSGGGTWLHRPLRPGSQTLMCASAVCCAADMSCLSWHLEAQRCSAGCDCQGGVATSSGA